jgi:hypothetical protein
MYPDDAITHRIQNASTIEELAEILDRLIASNIQIDHDGTLRFIRQQVGAVNGLKIHIFANEHPPPHFHIKTPTIEATFDILDCKLLTGYVAGRDRRLIQYWHTRAKPKLIQTWNELRPSDCPVGPIDN